VPVPLPREVFFAVLGIGLRLCEEATFICYFVLIEAS
jgi:hypothetical protein